MGVHRLPKDEGSWNRVPRHERVCLLCNCACGSLCDEKHVVFQCSVLQGLRDEDASLFLDVCTMKEYLWQGDLVSVAKIVHACLDKKLSCANCLFRISGILEQKAVSAAMRTQDRPFHFRGTILTENTARICHRSVHSVFTARNRIPTE